MACHQVKITLQNRSFCFLISSNFTVCVGATEQEIKDRYRKLALKWHPDKHAEKDSSVATEVMIAEF